MKRRFLLLLLLLLAATAWAVTYSQPFAASHGFAATQSGACDSSYADADDTTNGNPVNSVKSTCVGRNDSPTTTWKKSLTWEDMGVTPGNVVTQVDGALDHQRTTQTHAQVARVGNLEIMNSGESASCLASTPLEATFSYPNTTGTVSWATHNATGAIAPASGCDASSTTVVVRFIINPRTGNNGSATTQVNVDNLVLTITEVTPSTGRKGQVTLTLLRQ